MFIILPTFHYTQCGLLCKIMLKQHSIQPDFMNIIRFYYHTTIKVKVKWICSEMLDNVELIMFLFCCKSIKVTQPEHSGHMGQNIQN